MNHYQIFKGKNLYFLKLISVERSLYLTIPIDPRALYTITLMNINKKENASELFHCYVMIIHWLNCFVKII